MKLNVQQRPGGISVLSLPQDRFTTAYITVAFAMPRTEETVAANALVPFLLRRRSAAYPDMTALNRRLYELYGTLIDGNVTGVGDTQLLTISMEVIRDRCALDGETPVADAAAVLCELLFRPYLVDGVFDTEDVESEKRCMVERIRAEINEKRRLARRRCEQAMCQGEATAIPVTGTEEQVTPLTADAVTAAWKTILATAPVQIIAQGVDDPDALVQTITDEFAALGRTPSNRPVATPIAARDLVEQTEEMELNQCKLVLGFAGGLPANDSAIAAARLMNALLGGTAHSLLFRHVREEQSLCYYCASSYDRYKSLLMIDSGVDLAMVDKAKTEILKQLTAIQNGEFTEAELEDTKRSMTTHYGMIEDEQESLSAWYVGQAMMGYPIQSPTDAAKAVAALSKQDVIDVAKRFALGCVYLLQPCAKEATV